MSNVDEIIEAIRASADAAEAKTKLLSTLWKAGDVASMLSLIASIPGAEHARVRFADGEGLQSDSDTYRLTPQQAQAILDLRLHRLTSLERTKLWNDYESQLDEIKRLIHILTNPDVLEGVIFEELEAVRERYTDPRRSVIEENAGDISLVDLIAEEKVVVTLSKEGYVKAQSLEVFRVQNRGGKGKVGTELKDTDIMQKMFVTSNHNLLLCFSNLGRVHWVDVLRVPVAGRTAKGRPIANLISLGEGEVITEIMPIERDYQGDETSETRFVCFATRQGTIKRTALSHFSRPRKTGLNAIKLSEGDEVVNVGLTSAHDEIMLLASSGRAIRFYAKELRPLSRIAAGVRGMRIDVKDHIVRMLVIHPSETAKLLTVCKKGYGKCSSLDEFSTIKRGGKGMIAIKTSGRNGVLVGAELLRDEKEIMLISNSGQLIRTNVDGIPVLGRNTQGVRLVSLDAKDALNDVAPIASDDEQSSLSI